MSAIKSWTSDLARWIAIGALCALSCGGTRMGYRWPDPAEWQNRTLPPRVLGLDARGYSAPLSRAAQYQLETCERIAAAYSERASNRVQTGTLLSGSGGFLAAAGVILVGASQVVDQASRARDPLLWSGVTAGSLGAVFSLVEAFSGSTQATAYNDAATHVRASMADFLSNIRSHDKTAGEELTEEILSERLCSLREDCKTPEFDVSEVGHAFGDSPREDLEVETLIATLCTPSLAHAR